MSEPLSPSGMPPLDRHEKMTVGVIVERRKVESRWQDYSWRPVEIVIGAPATAAWTLIREEGPTALFFAGTFTLELHPRETASYKTNLEMGAAVYVVLRPDDGEPQGMRLQHVTVSPYEAEAYTVSGTDLVAKTPMPELLAAWLDDYIKAFHVEEQFRKRQRDKPRAARPRP